MSEVNENKYVAITKINDEKRIVYGEVYAPNRLDSHGEFMTAEEIEKLAHKFLQLNLSEVIDTNHDNVANGAYPVESFIARAGDPEYTEGAWVIGVKVTDLILWNQIKRGKINGFSMEAYVMKVEQEVVLEIVRDHFGETEPEPATGHSHRYFVQLDDTGNVVRGWTDEVDGHSHEIVVTSFTLAAGDGHGHRYFL